MKKAAFILITILLLYVFAEISLRTFLHFTSGAPFFKPSGVIYKYYPQIPPIQTAQISNTDSVLDILVLSCSVLHSDWGDIISAMNSQMQLPPQFNKLRIYNASGVGHSSYDNYIKYTLLADKHFDLVIYYDAINDARLNDCPEKVFKDDYSHYQWYDEINNILRHPEMDITVIPYFIGVLKIEYKHFFCKDCYIPIHYSLRPDWAQYGNMVKSLFTYNWNLDHMISIAGKNNSRFMDVSFLYYLPADYTLEKFKNKSLDYTFCNRSRETEIWGQPAYVANFINLANLTSAHVVMNHKNASYEDLTGEFPRRGKYFADICHFSPDGLDLFANLLCKRVERIMMPNNNLPEGTSSSN
jgi:hypothetical protein